MNIESLIDNKIWLAISSNYGKNNYTGAILDSIYYLAGLIREKANLESDGIQLVGQAFGGANPRLKINKLQSENEKNEQKGIEQILRGIFQAIRNPRSHRKFNDTKETADSLIIFINYLTLKIDNSKSKFSIQEIKERVFDKDFVESDKYANIIIKEIPQSKRFESFVEVFKSRSNIEKNIRLRFFLRNLLRKLKKDEKIECYQILSEELKFTDSDSTIKLTLSILNEYWRYINEGARLRIENKIIKYIPKGEIFDNNGYNNSGAFLTWTSGIFKYFSLKEEFVNAVLKLLNDNDEDRVRFASKWAIRHTPLMKKELGGMLEWRIKEQIDNNNRDIYLWIKYNSPEKWQEKLKNKIEEYEQRNGDDLPF